MPINGSWRQLRVEMSHLISKVNYTLTFYSSIYSYFGSLHRYVVRASNQEMQKTLKSTFKPALFWMNGLGRKKSEKRM